MTSQQANQLLNKINTAFGGRVFQTDKDGFVTPQQVDFYMANVFGNVTPEHGEKLYDRLVTGYETISRSQNLVKFFKDVMPKGLGAGDTIYYPITAYQLFYDLVFYLEIENTSKMPMNEVFSKIERQITGLIEIYPARKKDQIHYHYTSPHKLWIKEIQGMINRLVEQQPNQPLHELDSQRETEKENLPFQEYNYLNLQS